MPLLLGTAVALLFHYSAVPAIVIGPLLASHTLLSLPIIIRLGESQLEPVMITVGATVVSDTLFPSLSLRSVYPLSDWVLGGCDRPSNPRNRNLRTVHSDWRESPGCAAPEESGERRKGLLRRHAGDPGSGCDRASH